MKGRLRLLCCLLSLGCGLRAETPIQPPDLTRPSKVAPAYFGPNAFPIPDMLDGTCSRKLRIELTAEHWFGTHGDQTGNIFAKVTIPLFIERVNLTLWIPTLEFFRTTTEWRNTCRVPNSPETGLVSGDIYVTTDIWVLKQTATMPDITVRAALKTASSEFFEWARHYNSPGYFFDISIAKSLYWENRFVKELRFAVSTGFLCWQTDNDRQNDAGMYGVQVKLDTQVFRLSTTFGGYAGLEKDGDCPMSLKAQLSFPIKGWEPLIGYQAGLMDFPYHQVRIGCAYHFSVLKSDREAKSTSTHRPNAKQ